METSKQPRVVVVTRPSWYQELLARHGTREQAKFFLETRGQSIDSVDPLHHEFERALKVVLQAIPVQWRRARIDRRDLDRFLFEPEDIVIALGQDGLVANTAKYLTGQPVIGLNPSPDRYEGVLVPLPPEATGDLLATVAAGGGSFEQRTMVDAQLDDGQQLRALNEIFVGHQSHQSARYQISFSGQQEYQSSSGVIVSTGTGSTGWARSIRRERVCDIDLPEPSELRLAFFVREAWPSIMTGTSLSEGSIREGQRLVIVSRMNEGGVLFGDGIEKDRIEFNWGRRALLSLSPSRLNLMRA